MAKHGAHVFTFEVVACAQTWDDILATESALILQYNTHVSGGLGYNMTYGGDGTVGYQHTNEAKEVMRSARLKWVITAETSAKISAANLGKKRTPEQKERYRAAAIKRGRPSPSTIEKSRVSRLGMSFTAEHRANLSAAACGRPKSAEHRAAIGRGNKGKVLSPETRAKMSAAKKAVSKQPDLFK